MNRRPWSRLSVLLIGLLVISGEAHSQSSLYFPLAIQHGDIIILDTIGYHSEATYCADIALGEFEFPPMGFTFDAVLAPTRSGSGGCDDNTGLGRGVRLNLHRMPVEHQVVVDTFRIQMGNANDAPTTRISWNQTLAQNPLFRSIVMKDAFGGFLVNRDMKDTSSVEFTSAITTIFIYVTIEGSGVVNTPPGEFTLLSPANDEKIRTTLPKFSWRRAIDPDPQDTVRYRLYLDEATPETTEEEYDAGTDTTFQLPRALTWRATYSWRVVAYDRNGGSRGNTGGYYQFDVDSATGDQVSIYFPLTLQNGMSTIFDTLGYHPQATYCVDWTLGEFEFPPLGFDFDAVFAPTRTGSGGCDGGDNLGRGVRLNLHQMPAAKEIILDTFRIDLGNASGNPTTRISWDQSLARTPQFKNLRLIDPFGGLFVNLDMKTASSVTFSSAITSLFLYVTIEGAEYARVIAARNFDIGDEDDILHITEPDPLISWEFLDSQGEEQTHYQVQVSPSADFSSYVWNTGEVGSDSSLIRYAGSPLERGETYYARVRVASTGVWSGWTAQMFRRNSLPSPPIILSPPHNAVLTTPRLTMKFLRSADAEGDAVRYVFSLSNNKSLSPLLLLGTILPGTSDTITYTLGEQLMNNQTYYWAVQSVDDYEYGPSSDTVRFFIEAENDPPTGFLLVSPLQGSTLNTRSPRFVWTKATDPDPGDLVRYKLYVRSPDFQVLEYSIGTDTSYQLTSPLEEGSTYEWWVRAYDLSGAGRGSDEVRQFSIGYESGEPKAFFFPLTVEHGSYSNIRTFGYHPEASYCVDHALDESEVPPAGFNFDVVFGPTRAGEGGCSQRTTLGRGLYANFHRMPGETEVVLDTFRIDMVNTSSQETTMISWDRALAQLPLFKSIVIEDAFGGLLFSQDMKTASEIKFSSALSVVYIFVTIEGPPVERDTTGDFALIAPPHRSKVSTASPTFVWHRVATNYPQDTIRYLLLVDGKEPGVAEYIVGTDTSIRLPAPLEENAVYYWKVVAVDRNGTVYRNFGGYRQFMVDSVNRGPAAFELITPTDLSVEVTRQPLFVWEHAADSENDGVFYNFYLAEDSLFDNVAPRFVGSNKFLTDVLLTDNRAYYWKVIARDKGNSTSSARFKFWVNTVLEPPNPFGLIEPGNLANGVSLKPTYIWQETTDNDPNDHVVYRLVVSADSAFRNVIFTRSGLRETSLELQSELPSYPRYWWKVIATDTDGLETSSPVFQYASGIVDDVEAEQDLPKKFSLEQNYPNPFNPTTNLRFTIGLAGSLQGDERDDVRLVTLKVYNVLGEVVATLVNEEREPGEYSIDWDATGMPSGIYYYRIQAGEFADMKKMLLIR